MDKALIVGLGNPGKSYERTRHNMGFIVVDALAAKWHVRCKTDTEMKGSIASEGPAILLKPLTFMNLSGESVVAVMHYYKIALSRLLIIADDVALPLGQLRMRINSGTGGHNGLKSIAETLQTNSYARLRIGVGDQEDRIDHVLGRFTEEEAKSVPDIVERAVQAAVIWLEQGITSAMNQINSSTPSIGDANE